MGIKILKGIVYNICDSIASPPFQCTELNKNSLPVYGEWIIDIKNKKTKDEKGKLIHITLTDYWSKWFRKELKKNKILLKDIKKAEIKIKFNLKGAFSNIVECKIISKTRKFYYSKDFKIYGLNETVWSNNKL